MQYQGSKMGNETFYACENSTVPLPLITACYYVLAWTPFPSTECLPIDWWDSIAFKCIDK